MEEVGIMYHSTHHFQMVRKWCGIKVDTGKISTVVVVNKLR